MSNRTHNIGIAARTLSRVLVRPGEVFSFNQVVGERTADRGFKEAPIYHNGRIVPGTGGGVCQVSGTLYNAALLSGMKVVERSNHSMPVPYVPIGRDATVAYKVIDLKFKNPYPRPIYILSWATGNEVGFALLGSSEDKADIEVVSQRTATIPFPVHMKTDPSLPPGKSVVEQKGANGARGVVKRIIRRPGQEPQVEIVSTDYYSPRAKVVRVGPATTGGATAAMPAPGTPLANNGSTLRPATPGSAPSSPDNKPAGN